MSIDDAILMIQEKVLGKENKRVENDWQLPKTTILIIELVDIPLSFLTPYINIEMMPDLYRTNFIEIWLADYTGLEAFNNVELFCVIPEKWSGYYPRDMQKPYS